LTFPQITRKLDKDGRRKPLIRTLLIAAALVAFGLVIGRSSLQTVPVVKAQSADACTLGSLKGNYGYHFTGDFYDSQGYTGLYAAVGRFAAAGDGTFTAVETDSVDGTVTSGRKLNGTYTIKDDCTGSATFNDATTSKSYANFDIVLITGGKEVQFIEKDTDIIVSGTAKQQ
jgi:hypothetical protein